MTETMLIADAEALKSDANAFFRRDEIESLDKKSILRHPDYAALVKRCNAMVGAYHANAQQFDAKTRFKCQWARSEVFDGLKTLMRRVKSRTDRTSRKQFKPAYRPATAKELKTYKVGDIHYFPDRYYSIPHWFVVVDVNEANGKVCVQGIEQKSKNLGGTMWRVEPIVPVKALSGRKVWYPVVFNEHGSVHFGKKYVTLWDGKPVEYVTD